MKRTKTMCAALLLAAVTIASVLGRGTQAHAGDPPDIAVSLAFKNSRTADRPLYLMGDPIPAILYLQNREPGDVHTFRGFGGQPLHLFLTFQGPDGKGVTAPLLEGTIQSKTHVPPPPLISVGGVLRQVEAVETLPGPSPGPPWSLEVTIDDLTSYYSLPLPGEYRVRTEIPMRTYLLPFILDVLTNTQYAEIAQRDWEGKLVDLTRLLVTADGDGDGYYAPFGYDPVAPEPWLADCDDVLASVHPGPGATEIPGNGRDDDCNPETPDTLPPMGTVLVQADRHVVGGGTHPGSTKEPIPDMPLWVFDKSPGSCAAGWGISWQHYAEVWASCYPPDGQGVTDASGVAEISVAPGDYLLIGLDSALYVGKSVGLVGANETVRKSLQVLEKADGKKSAGKSKIVTGSELLIIEPEYVEWSGSQELYPFVFQSLGDWGVSTSIAPPEGFVADYPSLSTEVQNDTKAVQFTVTDIGSDWVDTKVKHKIKHKGKEFVIKSKIGVKKKKEKEK